MDMQRAFTILFLLAAACASLQAQDITGVWQGHFRSSNLPERYSAEEERYKFEVQFAQHDKTFQAVTYSYRTTVFYGKADAGGTVNPKTGKVLLQEQKITEMRMQGGGDACIMTCFLQYSKSGNEEFLEGTYVSMNERDSSNCGKGKVFLRKSVTSDFYEEPFLVRKKKETAKAKSMTSTKERTTTKTETTVKTATVAKTTGTTKSNADIHKADIHKMVQKKNYLLPQPVKPLTTPAPLKKELVTLPPVPSPHQADSVSKIRGKAPLIASVPIPSVLTARDNQLVQTIEVNAPEVILNIYDDGAIDNDTISVYLDKRQIVSHARLSDQPIVVKLQMDENNDYHELIMVAENEGDIPPNTSLMIVKAGEKRYEVRITSTEQKNAVVIFKYDKNK